MWRLAGFCGMRGLVRPLRWPGPPRGLLPARPPVPLRGFGPPAFRRSPLRRAGSRPGSVGLGLSARGRARRSGASVPPPSSARPACGRGGSGPGLSRPGAPGPPSARSASLPVGLSPLRASPLLVWRFGPRRVPPPGPARRWRAASPSLLPPGAARPACGGPFLPLSRPPAFWARPPAFLLSDHVGAADLFCRCQTT